MDDAWRSARDRLSDNDLDTASVHLTTLNIERLKHQIRNLFDVSDVLLLEADRHLKSGMTDAAGALVEHAAILAPDNPRIPLAQANQAGAHDLGFADQVGAIARGFSLELKHLPSRMRIIGALAAAGLIAWLWMTVIFGGAIALRHGDRLRHDLEHLLPVHARGIPMIVLFVVLFFVAPLATGLGLVPLALGWLAVLSLYMSWSERVTAIVVAIGVALTPQLNARYAAGLGVGGSDATALYHCYYGRCAGEPFERVKRAAARRNFDPLAKAMIGLHAKRLGAAETGGIQRLHEAVLHLSVASESDPTSYVIATNLANARYNRAQRRCAQNRSEPHELELRAAEYEAAARLNEQPAAAVLNRAMVSFQSEERADGAKNTSKAIGYGDTNVTAFAGRIGVQPTEGCISNFNANLLLADVLPSIDTLADHVLARVKSGALLVPFGALLAGIADASYMPIFGGLAALAVILMGLARSALRPAYHCAACHSLACERCRRELRKNVLCEGCLFTNIKGGFVDPKEKWLADRKTNDAAIRRRSAARFASVVVPGSGLTLLGHGAFGALYFAMCAFGLSLLLLSDFLIPPAGLVGNDSTVLQFAGLVAAGMGYLANMIHTRLVR